MALKDIEGFKNQEIADILGISLDNVKIRLHRARSRLKTDLAAGCSLDRDQENELTCEPKEQEE